MAEISVEGMSFRAYHGCMDEERVVGNGYLVDLYMYADTSKAELSDNLEETLDYAKAYDLVKKEMEIPSKLLEHVARRILEALHKNFPMLEFAEVQVSKQNPPIAGQAMNVSVRLSSEDF